MPSYRKDRINDLLLSFLATELHQLRDPRLRWVTLTAVNVTPDLKTARVYWSIPGDNLQAIGSSQTKAALSVSETAQTEHNKSHNKSHGGDEIAAAEQVSEVQHALEGAARLLKTKVGKELKLRYTPQLVFEYDKSVAMGFHIDSLLKQARRS